MFSIQTTQQHPHPAIYYGNTYVRRCDDDLSRAEWQVKAANRAVSQSVSRDCRIEAGNRALKLCGQLGKSRARLTRKTIIARNRARGL